MDFIGSKPSATKLFATTLVSGQVLMSSPLPPRVTSELRADGTLDIEYTVD